MKFYWYLCVLLTVNFEVDKVDKISLFGSILPMLIAKNNIKKTTNKETDIDKIIQYFFIVPSLIIKTHI